MKNDKNKEKLENKSEDKIEEVDNSVSSDDSKAEDKVEAANESVSSDDSKAEDKVEAADESVSSDDSKAEDKVEAADKSKTDKNSDASNTFKLPFIIGKKVGMTQLFSNNGDVFPATVIEAGPCYVTQLKTVDKEGYNSVQIGFVDEKDSKTNKSLLGHYKRSGVASKKHLKEFRLEKVDRGVELGLELNIGQYNVGEFLTVTGYSKGRGFAGHMKRHNFSGGRASHGKNSVMRKAGSVGAGTDPGKVWLGTRMAGRMGNDKVSIKNLEVLRLDMENNLIFLKGSIPGPNNNIVYLNKSN